MIARATYDEKMTLRERTLRSWYLTSKGERGSRSQFFELLESCTSEKFAKIIHEDLARPASGGLRSMEAIRNYSRNQPPSLEALRTAAPNVQTLQWFFIYRGYLQFERERVIERELPVSPAGVPREGWVDILAFDERASRPVLVELKQARATDSLTGVLLEVLGHWAFYMRHWEEFRRQLAHDGVFRTDRMLTPSIVIAAPGAYFHESLRRSSDSRRHKEIEVAAALIKCLGDNCGLTLRLLAIDDDWQEVGIGFGVQEWSIPLAD
jgi:hypothetical protein